MDLIVLMNAKTGPTRDIVMLIGHLLATVSLIRELPHSQIKLQKGKLKMTVNSRVDNVVSNIYN